jgi:NADH pyrophosphatase NudC (nudix superfamily)
MKSGETPEETAVREMKEETGFVIDVSRLVKLKERVYHYPASDQEAASILPGWNSMPATELVDLGWYSIATINSVRINSESRGALPSLPGRPIPGGKKTRRRRGRKVRKTRKS